MPSESDLTMREDIGGTPESKGKGRACPEDTSGNEGGGNEGGNIPKPTNLTERDLTIRMALRQVGYDVSKLKDGVELDEEAQEILKAKTTRTRIVTRSWPRDPKGKYITPENSGMGKMTSNGVQLWGATLYDFFRVRRIPDLASLSTLTTGSKLAAWMKKNGEEKFAADEMEWASLEDDPREVPPLDIAELINPSDMRIGLRLWGKSMPSKDVRAIGEDTDVTDVTKESREGSLNQKSNEKGKGKDEGKKGEKGNSGGDGGAKGIEERTPFHPSSYPAPWPLIPFSYPAPTIQTYIPLDRLPKKLVVHDPWNLLAARDYYNNGEGDGEGGDWTKAPDITHNYELHLSKDALKRLKDEAEKSEKKKAELEQKLGASYVETRGFMIRPTQTEPGPIEPPVFVVYPPQPPPEPVEETHLYISPAHSAGRGNHSIVYKAEWEVPRSLVMQRTLCMQCIATDIEEILKKEDGVDGSKKAARWKEKNGRLMRGIHVEPGVSVSLVPEGEDFETKNGKTTRKDVNKEGDTYNMRPGDAYEKMEYEGPVRPIRTRVPWISPNERSCSHVAPKWAYPPTTKVKVTAKLSLEHDRHLAAEARNYQNFPKHFFEHWNGLNLLPPLHDPTPVGAVVPQFYGYYVPVEPKESAESAKTDTDSDSDEGKPYLSPIMLLEDCGKPLDPKHLSIDQKHECAALYYRFHHAGWVHKSVAQRNILAQLGPLTVAPFYRACAEQEGEEEELCFRLIDFGRSHQVENGMPAAMEEMEVANLFGHMEF